jgi:hypothetical protein
MYPTSSSKTGFSGVEVDNIQDLAGNTFLHKSWEFFVDRNPMLWSGGIVKVGKYPDDEISVTRQSGEQPVVRP